MKKILAIFFMIAGIQCPAVAQMLMPAAFSVSDTGAATYQIPIDVPPGISGIEPRLALAYSSQAENLIAGVGWTVTGLSAIVRCPSTLHQDGAAGVVALDSSDRYCLDSQRLITKSGANGADGTEYRTEIEKYLKIVSHGRVGVDPYYGPSYFTVKTREGLTLEYGNAADSRIEVPGLSVVRVWALNKVSDANGNFMAIAYAEDAAHSTYYPVRIDYTGNSITGLVPASAVLFDYQARPDINSTGQGGKSISNVMRLSAIRTTTTGTSGSVMNYSLTYDQSPSTARSRLKQVTACSGAGVCYPSTVVNWDISGVTSNSLSSRTGLAAPGATASVVAGDMNGDGLDDLVHFTASGTPLSVSMNNGDGIYNNIPWIGPVKEYISSTSNLLGVFVGGMSGDSFGSLAIVYGPCVYLPNTNNKCSMPEASLDVYTFDRVNNKYSVSTWCVRCIQLGAESIVLPPADFTGDGRPDLAWITPHDNVFDVNILANKYWSGFDATKRVFGGFPGVNASQALKVVAMDANLDGLMDLAVWRSTGIMDLYINKGNSFTPYSSLIAGLDSPGEQQNWYEGDFNGDSLPDLVHIGTGSGSAVVDVLINRGVGFTRERWASGLPLGTGPRFLALDVNGDGKTDIVRIAQNDSPQADPVAVYRNTGAGFVAENWAGTVGVVVKATDQWLPVNLDGTGAVGLVRFNSIAPPGTGAVAVRSFIPELPSRDRMISIGALYDLVDIQYGTLPKILGVSYFRESILNTTGKPIIPSIAVVTRVKRYGSSPVAMSYGNFMNQEWGRVWFGFNWVQSRNEATGIVSRKYFRYDYPYIGLVDKSGQGTSAEAWNSLQLTQNTYQCTDFTSSSGCAVTVCADFDSGVGCTVVSGRRYFPYLAQTEEQAWDLSGAALPGTRTKWSMDSFGNATEVTVDKLDASGVVTGYSSRTVNTFLNDESRWWIGLPLKSTRTVNSPESNPIPLVPAPTPAPPPVTPAPGTAITPAQLMVILQILLDD